jgi:hypothetical protein
VSLEIFKVSPPGLPAGQKAIQLGAQDFPAPADLLGPNAAFSDEFQKGGPRDSQVFAGLTRIQNSLVLEPAVGIHLPSSATGSPLGFGGSFGRHMQHPVFLSSFRFPIEISAIFGPT